MASMNMASTCNGLWMCGLPNASEPSLSLLPSPSLFSITSGTLWCAWKMALLMSGTKKRMWCPAILPTVKCHASTVAPVAFRYWLLRASVNLHGKGTRCMLARGPCGFGVEIGLALGLPRWISDTCSRPWTRSLAPKHPGKGAGGWSEPLSNTSPCFPFLSSRPFCSALLSIALLRFAMLWFALLWFASLWFALRSFPFLSFPTHRCKCAQKYSTRVRCKLVLRTRRTSTRSIGRSIAPLSAAIKWEESKCALTTPPTPGLASQIASKPPSHRRASPHLTSPANHHVSALECWLPSSAFIYVHVHVQTFRPTVLSGPGLVNLPRVATNRRPLASLDSDCCLMSCLILSRDSAGQIPLRKDVVAVHSPLPQPGPRERERIDVWM